MLAAGRAEGLGLTANTPVASQELTLHEPGAFRLHSHGEVETNLRSSAGDRSRQRELSRAHVPVAGRHQPGDGMLLAVAMVSSGMWEATSQHEIEPSTSALLSAEPPCKSRGNCWAGVSGI